MIKLPQTEVEAIRYFANEEIAIKFVAEQRWPNGVVCPTCGRVDVSYLKSQRRWQCKSAHAKRQFSVKTGTIFEDSPLPLGIWLAAVWKIVNNKNGVSSYELASSLGITQKSAWFVGHRVREALKVGHFEKLSGDVAGDEMYAGRDKRNVWPPVHNKRAVVGLVEKKKGTGRLVATVMEQPNSTNALAFIKENVAPGAVINTDESLIYINVKKEYQHGVVNHSKHQYAHGSTSTNTIEGVWNLFRRSYRGTYTHMAPAHLGRYVTEHVYRYNYRGLSAYERFAGCFATSERRLSYQLLTSKI